VYLTSHVPKEYTKVNMVLFGKAENYPDLIGKVKQDIENANLSSIGSLRNILKVCDT
jgi:hypothetical protein